MKKMTPVLPALALLLGACAPAMTVAPTDRVQLGVGADAALGQYLTGPEGQTIYTFANDREHVSACVDQCLVNWPAVPGYAKLSVPPEFGGAFTIFTRPDGTRQLAYDGKPLYYWAKSMTPGDVSGNGVNNVWMLAQP